MTWKDTIKKRTLTDQLDEARRRENQEDSASTLARQKKEYKMAQMDEEAKRFADEFLARNGITLEEDESLLDAISRMKEEVKKKESECPECGKKKDDLEFRTLSRHNYGVMCKDCYYDKSVVGGD